MNDTKTPTKTAHTPGPWKANAGGQIISEDGTEISLVMNHDGDDSPTSANAALLETAPDLLAALDEIVRANDAALLVNGTVDSVYAMKMIATARAAIARAKGKGVE